MQKTAKIMIQSQSSEPSGIGIEPSFRRRNTLAKREAPQHFIKGNDVVVGFLNVETVNYREDSGEKGREDRNEEAVTVFELTSVNDGDANHSGLTQKSTSIGRSFRPLIMRGSRMAVQRESVATPIMQMETLATLTARKKVIQCPLMTKPGGNKK